MSLRLRSVSAGVARSASRLTLLHGAASDIAKMIVSVLEAGFPSLWRVRVLQGPAARHRTITSILSVVTVQVRMASPSCLSDGRPNVNNHIGFVRHGASGAGENGKP